MGTVENIWDDVGDLWDDIEDFVTEDIFGAPDAEERAQMAADAQAQMEAAEAGRLKGIQDVKDIRKGRAAKAKKRREVQEAGVIREETSAKVGDLVRSRLGTGGAVGSRGKERRKVRARKFKGSRPLRLGMKRP